MGLKNYVITVAIIVLTISVVVYGVNLLYDSPEYTDFCDEFKTAEVINNSEQCEAIGGKWNSYKGLRPVVVDGAEGFCDRDFTCRGNYDTAREKYSRNIFLIALPLGILIITVGALVFGLEAVGAGLMGGGVGIILWGVGGFWRFADDLLKFILSFAGLVIVIWVAYYFNKKLEMKKKKRKK